MKSTLLLLAVLGTAVLLPPAVQFQSLDNDDGQLKAEAAREALIDFVESSSDVPVKRSLPELKTTKVVEIGDNQITIGKWHCNLAKKTFVLSLASDAGLFEISGVFEKGKNQKWQAKVTEKKQT